MSGNEHWVFAYGSNMNPDDLRGWLVERGYRADGILQVERAVLPGYRLIWNYYSTTRNGGAANIEPWEGRELPGVALRVDSETFKAIDQKEGHPDYYDRGDSPRTVRLHSGQLVKAWVYVAVPSKCRAYPVWPCRAYLSKVIDAARTHGLPDWHIAELEATPTAD